MTFYCSLADLSVQIVAQEETTASYFADYTIEPCKPDVIICVTDDMISAEHTGGKEERYYLEFLAICRAFCRQTYAYGVFLLHAAVIEVNGEAFAFYAPSGTGKSTHIRFWRELLGKDCKIVNGDKPFIRKINDRFYAYGSPWCGTERWHRNVRVPLAALCRITRGEHDEIERLSMSDSASALLKQVYLPHTAEGTLSVMGYLDDLIRTVDSYTLACTPTITAAEVAHATLISRPPHEIRN